MCLCPKQGYQKEMKEFGSTRMHLVSAAPKVHNDSTKRCEAKSYQYLVLKEQQAVISAGYEFC